MQKSRPSSYHSWGQVKPRECKSARYLHSHLWLFFLLYYFALAISMKNLLVTVRSIAMKPRLYLWFASVSLSEKKSERAKQAQMAERPTCEKSEKSESKRIRLLIGEEKKEKRKKGKRPSRWSNGINFTLDILSDILDLVYMQMQRTGMPLWCFWFEIFNVCSEWCQIFFPLESRFFSHKVTWSCPELFSRVQKKKQPK